ncbi:MAG: hypothetical protein KA165_19865 [Saprospiraceae bacterium]|nr:hypothetical protein [Saprospiraceae bacterium]
MSDFDKIFAEKLDEEERFPGRNKNWKALSSRLDAFDTGLKGSRPNLRVWQAAAAVSLVATTVLLWKVSTLHLENAGLREQVATLQQQQLPLNNTKETAPAITPAEQANTGENFRSSADKSGVQNSGTIKNDATVLPGEAPKPFATAPKTFNKNGYETAPTQQPDLPGKNVANSRESDISGEEKKIIDATVPPAIAEIPPAGNDEKNAFAPDSARLNQPALPAKANLADLIPYRKIPFVLSRTQPEKQRLQSVAVSAAPIKPVQHNYSRFRLGVEALAGKATPKQGGISLITGAGLSAEYSLLRNLRVSASADWVQYNIDADSILEHCRFPDHPPMTGNPHHELTRVEGNQRSQHFALGLTYTVPVRFWVRPSLRLYHSWVRMSPSFLNFQFEEHGPGGPGGGHGGPDPEYKTKKLDTEWFDNIWRLGVGLEHETPRWAFGLWADYSKNPGSEDALFDTVFLRGGIQYKFD